LLKINKIPYQLGLNLCVLASGSGSNLKAIINAGRLGKISSKVVLVISNNSASIALTTAEQNKIPSYHLSQKLFLSQSEFDKKFLSLLKEYKVDLIILAGYMKMVSQAVTKKYKNRILNIHPALLPEFGGKGMYGIHVHEAVLKAGAKATGATVHLVDDVYDNGTVILQRSVNVKPGDTAESLQKRVLRVEHKLYPEAIKLFEEGKILIKGHKVIVNK
jgi:phosphoribosylglycinamide formyltransferase 1